MRTQPKKKVFKKNRIPSPNPSRLRIFNINSFLVKIWSFTHTQNKNEKNKKGVYHKIMCKKYLKKYPGIKNGLQSNKNNTISAIATTTPTIVLNTQYSDHSRIIVHSSTTADSGVLTCWRLLLLTTGCYTTISAACGWGVVRGGGGCWLVLDYSWCRWLLAGARLANDGVFVVASIL